MNSKIFKISKYKFICLKNKITILWEIKDIENIAIQTHNTLDIADG